MKLTFLKFEVATINVVKAMLLYSYITLCKLFSKIMRLRLMSDEWFNETEE